MVHAQKKVSTFVLSNSCECQHKISKFSRIHVIRVSRGTLLGTNLPTSPSGYPYQYPPRADRSVCSYLLCSQRKEVDQISNCWRAMQIASQCLWLSSHLSILQPVLLSIFKMSHLADNHCQYYGPFQCKTLLGNLSC